MKHGKKKLSSYSLLLIFGLIAGGLWLAEDTWAWPTVSVTDSGQITMGTVDYSLRVRQEDSEMPDANELSPGRYTIAIAATGDTEGWFLLCVGSAEDASETVYYRTEWMQPAQNMSFILELSEAAVLTVEPRWDTPQETASLLSEGDSVQWGTIPQEEKAEASEETEVTETTGAEEETGATEITEATEETGATEITEATEETGATETTGAAEETEATETIEASEETGTTETTQAAQQDESADADAA